MSWCSTGLVLVVAIVVAGYSHSSQINVLMAETKGAFKSGNELVSPPVIESEIMQLGYELSALIQVRDVCLYDVCLYDVCLCVVCLYGVSLCDAVFTSYVFRANTQTFTLFLCHCMCMCMCFRVLLLGRCVCVYFRPVR
jgi:hypothetical protein